MRESGYDPYVREFAVTDAGVTVLGPVESAEGLLTGLTRTLLDSRQPGREGR
jgi:hypothetical protein